VAIIQNESTLYNKKRVGSISIEVLNREYESGNYPYVTRTEKIWSNWFYGLKMAPANVLT
jgi:hypothetical protein